MAGESLQGQVSSDKRVIGIPVNGNPTGVNVSLTFNATTNSFDWSPAGGGGTLAGLSDVTLAGLANGDLILFDTTDAKWHNKILSGDITITKAGVSAIGTLKITTAMIQALAVTNAKLAADIVAAKIVDFDTQVITNRLDEMATPTTDVEFGANKLTGVADPTLAQDAATKAYGDANWGSGSVGSISTVTNASNQTVTSATFVDVTSLTKTLNASGIALFTAVLCVSHASSTGRMFFCFSDNGTDITGQEVKWKETVAGGDKIITISYVTTQSSQIVKVRVRTEGGNTTIKGTSTNFSHMDILQI
jgi:hypothetical protein